MIQKTEHRYEKIYQKFGENLPWCLEEVPEWFKGLVEHKWVFPGKALDIGCGLGSYATYLARQGFDVTGIDVSETAIDMANKRNPHKGVEFKVGDAFDLGSLEKKFDFVYEISLLHNLHPEQRTKYIESVQSVLNPKGKFLVCCFSDQDEHFQGKKELYFPDLDNTVYPLSRDELVTLFKDKFDIESIGKVYTGRTNQRQKERWLCLMRKK